MKNEELLQLFINHIGDQYEDYEFLVYQKDSYEIIEGDFVYDIYYATNKLKLQLEIPKNKEIILYFNADILSRIEIL
ncbi:hypothetical protein HZQ35_08685 [Elizabethkingia anophelis]|nr:hypothetical protein [Elizabethkingia anophelis]MCT3633678.1 hypothetical protein [Elizabethkingia anophelis]MCT3727858.1 hypothetical protein [Elizabethkingia anophelis]MCT3830389.1 hypothetical protein [Elizabethkingia anophelis]MCT3883882.1 hypothetical protein [Elizabethkingia anophelis]